MHVQPYGPQAKGACLWRTQDISDPKSWRAWNGTGFTVRFLDPYVNNISDPAQHVCAPVGANTIETGSESLTWSTYFKKWLLVRAAGGGAYPSGFYAYTSDDLINWGQGTLIVTAKLPWAHTCGEPDYLEFPSLLDPESKSRNFETTGQRPLLFFTHFNVWYTSPTQCNMSLDRDLVRVPIELSNQQPGGPAASLSASTTSARTGETVTFDASRSRDTDGTIVRYEWDLDGDGTYERNTGTSPVAQTAYDAPDSVTVTVRVSDNDGKATDDTRIVHVTSAGRAAGRRRARARAGSGRGSGAATGCECSRRAFPARRQAPHAPGRQRHVLGPGARRRAPASPTCGRGPRCDSHGTALRGEAGHRRRSGSRADRAWARTPRRPWQAARDGEGHLHAGGRHVPGGDAHIRAARRASLIAPLLLSQEPPRAGRGCRTLGQGPTCIKRPGMTRRARRTGSTSAARRS